MLEAPSPSPPADDDKSHGHEENRDDYPDSIGSYHDIQAGVQIIEAISQTWTQWSLISAYVG